MFVWPAKGYLSHLHLTGQPAVGLEGITRALKGEVQTNMNKNPPTLGVVPEMHNTCTGLSGGK